MMSQQPDMLGAIGYPAAFLQQLNDVIATCNATNSRCALLVISIDNLAMLMRGFGHEGTEAILHKAQDSIRDMISASDKVWRIQRDQFAIVLQSVQPEELGYLAERIQSHLQNNCAQSEWGVTHLVSTIMQLWLPDQAQHADDAMSRALIGLQDYAYRMGGAAFYEENPQQVTLNRQEMALANHLVQAMQQDKLLMAYQPIISATDGSVHHYEALLRMRGDDGSVSSAGALIPVAERMGLIEQIDRLTLIMTVTQLRRHPEVHLAFNISNITTQSDAWLALLKQTLKDEPQVASRLIVEITETAVMHDLQNIAYFIAEIQALGCLVALDDFGSGYTSFRQLKSLSVDMVKIDGAFIKDLVENTDNQFFVRTLLDFTNGFGLQSVAEYVENGEIAKLLMELGVNMLQGYYFGRPTIDTPWMSAVKPYKQ
jgi:EAL domain-containing protein (putative c-di-GMP-specific phosphodiesterase class I)/GGDEF domain-containing protein